MTGQNKYVLSVFAKIYRTDKKDLETVLLNCKDILTKQDFMQLQNASIPTHRLNLKTKEDVLNYILGEVKFYINQCKNINHPYNRERAFNKLVASISNKFKKVFN